MIQNNFSVTLCVYRLAPWDVSRGLLGCVDHDLANAVWRGVVAVVGETRTGHTLRAAEDDDDHPALQDFLRSAAVEDEGAGWTSAR